MEKVWNFSDGRKAVFNFDERGIGEISLECMDMIFREFKPVIRCCECRQHQAVADCPGTIICKKHGTYMPYDGFCSCAERISNKL